MMLVQLRINSSYSTGLHRGFQPRGGGTRVRRPQRFCYYAGGTPPGSFLAIVGRRAPLCKVDAGGDLAKGRLARRITGRISIDNANTRTLRTMMVPATPKRRGSRGGSGMRR